jgi:hypothetical protein
MLLLSSLQVPCALAQKKRKECRTGWETTQIGFSNHHDWRHLLKSSLTLAGSGSAIKLPWLPGTTGSNWDSKSRVILLLFTGPPNNERLSGCFKLLWRVIHAQAIVSAMAVKMFHPGCSSSGFSCDYHWSGTGIGDPPSCLARSSVY